MNKEKPEYHKCHLCDKDAVGCFSPDLDIKGLCFCKKHKWEVMEKYYEIFNKNNE